MFWLLPVVSFHSFLAVTLGQDTTQDDSQQPPCSRCEYGDEEESKKREPLDLFERIEADVRGGQSVCDARITIGNQYDSNVLFLGESMPVPTGFNRKGDYRFGLEADFNFSHVFLLDRHALCGKYSLGRSLTLGFGGTVSQNWHPNISEFDQGRYAGRAFTNWETDINVPYWHGFDRGGVYLGLEYEHATTTLDRDTFFFSSRIMPTLTLLWRRDPDNIRWQNSMDRTIIYYDYDKRNFQEEIFNSRLDRDGNYHTLGVQHSIYLIKAQDLWCEYYNSLKDQDIRDFLYSHEWLRCHLGYEYQNHRTDGTEFDLIANSILWGVHLPLPYQFAFDVEGAFTWGNYGNASIFEQGFEERFDFMQRYNFGLTYTFKPCRVNTELVEAKIRAGVELNFQDSNITNRFGGDVYEYDRTVFGLQAEIRFVPTRYGPRGRGTVIRSHSSGPMPSVAAGSSPAGQVTETLGMPPAMQMMQMPMNLMSEGG